MRCASHPSHSKAVRHGDSRGFSVSRHSRLVPARIVSRERGSAQARRDDDWFDDEDDREDDVMDELDALAEKRSSSAVDAIETEDDCTTADPDSVTTTRIEPVEPIQHSREGASSFASPSFLATLAAIVAVPAVAFFAFQEWRKASLSGGGKVRVSPDSIALKISLQRILSCNGTCLRLLSEQTCELAYPVVSN
jgi:hypothetical protein